MSEFVSAAALGRQSWEVEHDSDHSWLVMARVPGKGRVVVGGARSEADARCLADAHNSL